MLQELLKNFINNYSEKDLSITPREKEFINSVFKFTNIEMEKFFKLENKPLADYINSMGFIDVAIKWLENSNDLTYKNPNDLDYNPNVENLVKSRTLANVGIYCTIVNERITAIVSSRSQIQAIKDNAITDDEYDVFVAWPWDIKEKNISLSLMNDDIQGENQHLIMATGQPQVDKVAQYFSGFIVDKIVDYRKDLLDECTKYKPDILVVSDNIGGSEDLISLLINVKYAVPSIRIVYFTSELTPRDDVRRNLFSVLISMGVYDILFDNRFSVDILKHLLKHPKTINSVNKILLKNNSKKNQPVKKMIELVVSEDEVGSSSIHSMQNVYGFISSKGGTGKSFIASNVAVAIEKWGINNLQGRKPKVALIDGDFLGFGLTQLLKAEDKEKNLMAAIGHANSVVDAKKEGKISSDKAAVALAVESIKECFVPLKENKNIEFLGGGIGPISDEDYQKVNSYAIVFIIEAILKEYDIIIADITSDIELKLWYPLFVFSRELYSIIDADLLSVTNCLKQQKIISEFIDKSTKLQYIYNKCLDGDEILFKPENIQELSGFVPIAKVPYISREKMINYAYEGKLIINEEEDDSELIRFEFLKLANRIWPIKDFDKIAEKIKKKNVETEVVEEKSTNVKDVLKKGFSLLFPFKEEAEKKSNR